ncbi:MAG: lysophospholipid acyltransferase family protein [Pyrinomonadaceae bacterium]
MKNKETDQYPPQLVADGFRLIGYVISKTFWFIRFRGRENIPEASSGSFLIAANHQTYMDPVWIVLPMRRRLRFMAFDQAFGWPVIGPLIKYLGAFPVSMEVGGTLRAMKAALRALRNGAALTIFPEGAREFADGEMFEFKTGAVRIALQAGVPILPVTINGGNRIWPQKQKYPYLFRRAEIIYHPLLHLAEHNKLEPHENLEFWTQRLKEIIVSGLEGKSK